MAKWWKVNVIHATWNDEGNVVINLEIILPEKSISKPEALAVGKWIEYALNNGLKNNSRIAISGRVK